MTSERVGEGPSRKVNKKSLQVMLSPREEERIDRWSSQYEITKPEVARKAMSVMAKLEALSDGGAVLAYKDRDGNLVSFGDDFIRTILLD